MIRLILASGSPRRREILQNLGIPFEVITCETDESCSLTDPAEYVRELATRKGLAVRDIDAVGLADGETVEEDVAAQPHDITVLLPVLAELSVDLGIEAVGEE